MNDALSTTQVKDGRDGRGPTPASRRVLVLNYEYPPLGGGAGRVARDLCDHLARQGVEQTVLTGWMPGLKFVSRENGVEVIRVPIIKTRRDRTSVAGMCSYVLAAFPVLVWLLLTRSYDVSHAHFVIPTGVLAWAAKRLFGLPYVLTLHGGDVPGMVPDQTDKYFKFIGSWAKRVAAEASTAAAVSPWLRDLARSFYGPTVRYVPNAVGQSWLEAMRPAPRPERPVRIAFAARLVRQKNPSALIKGFLRLRPTERFHLDILGDGPLLGELKALAAEDERITFHGWVEETQVREALRKADVFVLPSYSEGHSISALQALASGCALVLSDIPANAGMVEEGVNGSYCGFEPEDIAEAIQRCLPNLEGMQRASLEMAGRYSWSEVGREYVRLYERAAA